MSVFILLLVNIEARLVSFIFVKNQFIVCLKSCVLFNKELDVLYMWYTDKIKIYPLYSQSVLSTPGGKGTPRSRTRLQSCVNLGDSPRTFQSGFSKPKRLDLESPPRGGEENKDPEFRTPNLCSRPSFR